MLSAGVHGTPRIFGILPTYRRQGLLADVLEKIAQQLRAPDCLVIVDNEFSEHTKELVAEFGDRHPETMVILIQSQWNRGSAGGWALGMEEALKMADDEDWILTLDDDDPPRSPTELHDMLIFAEQQRIVHPDLGAVGIVGAKFNWLSGYLVRLQDEQLEGAVDVDYVASGHGAMYLARSMREQGVFQADLFFGHTEIEYCLRLRAAGYRVLANGDLWKTRRIDSGRIGITVRPERKCRITWRKYYGTRNYIFMMRRFRRVDLALKHALIQTLVKPLYTLPSSPALAYRGFRLALKASIDGFLSRMGRTIEPASFKM